MAVSMENVSAPTNANAFLGTQAGAAVKVSIATLSLSDWAGWQVDDDPWAP